MEVGRLERLPLREVWKHEALDFTVWLQSNIEVLGDAIDIDLSSAEREQSAGDFKLDVLAEDAEGNPVVIENQLAPSDHDHLGKLITYLTAFDAKVAVWVVSDPRPEHVKAITWLNESSSASFYLLKVEAVRIAESPPASLLTLIVGPSEEGRDVGRKKKEMAERHVERERFWTSLLDRSRATTKLFVNISPGTSNWISTGAGKTGISYMYCANQHETFVQLAIERTGDAEEEENQAVFDQLYAQQRDIEEQFGEELIWDQVEGRRIRRVMVRFDDGGWRDEERWTSIHDKMIDAMIRLEMVLRPRIDKLEL